MDYEGFEEKKECAAGIEITSNTVLGRLTGSSVACFVGLLVPLAPILFER
jgi:hypothetical protein